jgi:hypothetical protein
MPSLSPISSGSTGVASAVTTTVGIPAVAGLSASQPVYRRFVMVFTVHWRGLHLGQACSVTVAVVAQQSVLVHEQAG